MLKLCLRTALRPAVQTLPGVGRHNAPSRRMGTHGRNEPRESLNSPKRAKEFIYRLQPPERTCLLKELQSFESIAIAQGKRGERVKGDSSHRYDRYFPATVFTDIEMHFQVQVQSY